MPELSNPTPAPAAAARFRYFEIPPEEIEIALGDIRVPERMRSPGFSPSRVVRVTCGELFCGPRPGISVRRLCELAPTDFLPDMLDVGRLPVSPSALALQYKLVKKTEVIELPPEEEPAPPAPLTEEKKETPSGQETEPAPKVIEKTSSEKPAPEKPATETPAPIPEIGPKAQASSSAETLPRPEAEPTPKPAPIEEPIAEEKAPEPLPVQKSEAGEPDGSAKSPEVPKEETPSVTPEPAKQDERNEDPTSAEESEQPPLPHHPPFPRPERPAAEKSGPQSPDSTLRISLPPIVRKRIVPEQSAFPRKPRFVPRPKVEGEVQPPPPTPPAPLAVPVSPAQEEAAVPSEEPPRQEPPPAAPPAPKKTFRFIPSFFKKAPEVPSAPEPDLGSAAEPVSEEPAPVLTPPAEASISPRPEPLTEPKAEAEEISRPVPEEAASPLPPPKPVRVFGPPARPATVELAVEHLDPSSGRELESLPRLQEIFLTEETLGIERVMELCGGLPGIRSCILAKGDAVVASFNVPNNWDIVSLTANASDMLAALRSSTMRMGLGAIPAVTIHSEKGPVSFLHAGDLALLVLHADRGFVPGVRERLRDVVAALAASNIPLPIEGGQA